MQVPPLQAAANAATGRLVGALMVPVPLVKFRFETVHRFSEFVPKLRKYSGEPAGGGVRPSRSAGSTPPKAFVNWKQTCVAGCPASMEVRSSAHNLEPAKAEPLLKML